MTDPTKPAPAASDAPLPPVGFWEAFRFWLKLGFISFGGPAGQISITVLTWIYGWEHTLTQMGWFFTKAALLTFGGAYAVLPYVYQGAVGDFGWLMPAQMIDGLALGETTPGPLIMVVAFVGFVGGYVKAIFGPDSQFLAGAVETSLVTWFPSCPPSFSSWPVARSSRRPTTISSLPHRSPPSRPPSSV